MSADASHNARDRLREKHPLASPGWLAYIGSVTERTGLPDCDFPVCQPGCPDSRDDLCSRLQAILDRRLMTCPSVRARCAKVEA